MEEKKWFPLARRSVATSRNKVIFQKVGSPGFHKQNENLKWNNIVSTRQKVGFHQQEWRIHLRISFY